MKKHLFRSGFNLIEVTMAIAIVGIGIAGVMALFPPAIEANKAANFQNFTGTVVDNIAAYLGYELSKKPHGVPNWDTFKNSLPASKNDAPKPPTETKTDEVWEEVSDLGVFKTSKAGVLGIKSHDGSIAAHVRVWRDDGNLAQYSILKDTNNDGVRNAQTQITPDSSLRIRVVIELSWPIVKDYDNGQTGSAYQVLRETQEFVYEFNKPE